MHVLCGHVRRLTAAPVSVRFGRRSERLRRRTDTEEAYTAGRGGCGLSASSRRTSRSCTHPVRRRAPGAASGSRHSRSVRRPWRAQWLDGRRGIPPDHLGCQRPLRECVRPCALLAVPVRSSCAPVLRAPVRACVDERAGGRVEAVAALETRMAGTSGPGLCGIQVWAHDSAVTHVCGGCRTTPGSRG